VRRCPEVRDCYLMTGLSDYLMRIEVLDAGAPKRIRSSARSLSPPHHRPDREARLDPRHPRQALPGVARIQSSFAIRTVVGRG
jgi:DNA-binding Lrp family transcriptional regulator